MNEGCCDEIQDLVRKDHGHHEVQHRTEREERHERRDEFRAVSEEHERHGIASGQGRSGEPVQEHEDEGHAGGDDETPQPRADRG